MYECECPKKKYNNPRQYYWNLFFFHINIMNSLTEKQKMKIFFGGT